MKRNFIVSLSIVLGLFSCKTADPQDDSNLESKGRAPMTYRLICKFDTDSVSKGFRPKKLSEKIEIVIAAKTVEEAKIDIGEPGTVHEIESLKVKGGDEGYNEFEVPKALSKKFGFDFVIINYNASDKTPTPKSAKLVNEGAFATCKASGK